MLGSHWVALVLVLIASACSSLSEAATLRWHNSLQPKGQGAVTLALAENGATRYVIVVPAAATTQDQKAAEDLAHWLGQMTGATFATVPDTEAPRPTEISIGRTNRLAAAHLPQAKADLGTEGYAIGVAGERLFLLGGSKRGPINAVYALLEEDLGCRWYSRDYTRIPTHPTLRFAPVPRSYVPRLRIRDPFYWDAFDATWSLRNRTNAPNAPVPEKWGGHIDYDGLFVHTFNTLVPPSKYFAKHPEYYMLTKDGKRSPRQLCLSNPDVVRIATESVLAILKRNPHTEIVSVSPNDGGGHCLCPACKAIDDANGSPSGSLITFVNKIAEAVEKVRPDVMVSTLAYLDTIDPPSKVRPRHNVAIRLCDDLHSWRYPFTCFATANHPESKRFRDAIIGWSKICSNIDIWDYFVNFSHYLAPMPNMDILAPSIDFYIKHNVTGIMMQGAYQGPGGAFAPLRVWVMAKLMWDPSRKVPDLVNDFIAGYYGDAAGDIKAYWDLLYADKAKHMATMDAPKGGIRYPMDSPFLSRDFLTKATAIFARAEAKARATSPDLLHRVQLAKLSILYVKLAQGPKVWGDEYAADLAEFETIARREHVEYLREGGPDLDEKLKSWRDALRVSQSLGSIKPAEATITSLAPEWKFATDPKNVGVQEKWYAEGLDDSGWATVRTDKGNGWEHQGFPDYLGYGWYRQRVQVPASLPGKHLYLYFAGVDEDAEVYINGQKAFAHTCASTGLTPDQIWLAPFCFDARPFVHLGAQNTIAVRVLNRLGQGGIYLPVHEVVTDHELDAPLIRALIARQK